MCVHQLRDHDKLCIELQVCYHIAYLKIKNSKGLKAALPV